MPVCCKESSDSIELTTKSLNLLSDCETIAWLRSATPLKTYADVQQAYNDANPSNLFFSNSINSNVAVLKVKPPVSCDADSTWYYAAYVSKKKVAQKNITGNSTYQGSVVGSGGTTIGSYVNIADQNAQAPACQSSPTIKLTVNVTEYTGRPNNMIIAIEDKIYSLITAVYNQAGVGSYDINTAALANIPLNEINILVYDYNCGGGSCTASSATFTAKRVVTYPGIQKPTFEEACSVAAADTITFSPNASVCKTLASVFTGFSVAPDNCSANINWQTVNEMPGNSFIIEKSTDGRNFTTLSKVQSQNKTINNYTYTDNNPASGKNYYRVIEQDANGKSFSTLTKNA